MNHKNNPNFDFYSFGEPPKAEPNTPPVQEESWHADVHENFAPMLDTAALHRATTLSYSRVGFALALTIVLWFALSAVVVAIGVGISPTLGNNLMFTSLAGTLPLYIVGTPLMYLMVFGLPTARPTPKKLTLSFVVMLFLMAQGLMWAGNFIGEGLMGIMGRLTGVDYYNQLNDTVGLPIWFTVILTGILAPIFEELIFRKLMLDRMLPCGEGQAILINGLLFGLFHSNLYQFFYAASLGMLLSFVYAKTGTWRYTALLHIAINFMGGILPAMLLQKIDYNCYLTLDTANAQEIEAFMAEYGPEMSLISLYSAAQIILGLAGIVLLILKFRTIKASIRPSLLPFGKGMKAALLNGGMLCAIGICTLLLITQLIPFA